MNNICIYAEVIALARFFLGLLLSPKILNIQLSSPSQSWGCSEIVYSLGSLRRRGRGPGRKGGLGWALDLQLLLSLLWHL